MEHVVEGNFKNLKSLNRNTIGTWVGMVPFACNASYGEDRTNIRKTKEQHELSIYTDDFVELITKNTDIMRDLSIVKGLYLKEWYIAAGYVRNYIWDTLHGYSTRTPLNDIDIIYFDTEEKEEESEKKYEQILHQETGSSLWSVKNQARMHIRNGNKPYKSIEDAISYWPETVTAVGIKLEEDNSLTFVSPYGLDDIFECRVRRSPLFKNEVYYRSRVSSKNWKELWPKLEIIWG